jgi:hypothetical protein
MTRMRVLTPGLVDFRELLGAPSQDPAAYQGFWDSAHDPARTVLGRHMPDPQAVAAPRLEVARTQVRSRFERYSQIDVDTLERPVEALVLRLDAAHVTTPVLPQADCAGQVVIECRLYDHGVFVLEAEVPVLRPAGLDAGAAADFLDRLQTESVGWGALLAREVHDRYLVPLVAELRRLDRREEVLAPAETEETGDHGRVLWVSRSLVLDPATPAWEDLAAHWVKDSAGDVDPRSVVPSAPDPRGHVVRWLNYLLVGTPATAATSVADDFADVWTALRLAQYFYAALENIDAQLTRVLGQSLAALPAVTVQELRTQLEDCSRRAQFITMHLQDVTKYLTRAVRAELAEILEYWELDDVVVAPVGVKVEACERRLRELAELRTARASLFTDTILLGIGITSILGTTVALTEFGRTMAVDPGMAGYDTSQSTITSWIAAQPADLLLFAAVGISVLLAVVYTYFRRTHHR